MKRLDILAFSPHPDDAELGCSGCLLLAMDKGLHTAIADLSEGECSSRGTLEQRLREKARAAELLGIAERFSLGLPDTQIGFDVNHRFPVIELIRVTQPRIVLAPYWVDRHPDHESAGRLVRSACYYAGVAGVGQGIPYRPKHLYYYMIHTSFEPSFVLDVSHVWDRKKAILEAYVTQFTNMDKETMETFLSRPEFLEYQEVRAAYYGAMICVDYGEPFFSPAPISLRMLPGLEGSEPAQRKRSRTSPF